MCGVPFRKVGVAGHRSGPLILLGIVIEVASTAARVRKVVSGGSEVVGG